MGNCLNDGDYSSVYNPQYQYIFVINNNRPVTVKIKEGVIVRVYGKNIILLNRKSMNEFYEFKEEIGKGAAGSVFLCIEKRVGILNIHFSYLKIGHKYAIKKMLKPQKKKKEFQDTIKNEQVLSSSVLFLQSLYIYINSYVIQML